MGRPLRVVLPDKYYFITNRCLNGEYVMRPDGASKMIILGVLARAVVQHNVEVVSFVFMSNHFHLICRFPEYNMAEFMSQLTGQLSRRLNKLRNRSGPVFPDRYHSQVLFGPAAITDKINYVVNNPVKDGLVAEATEWPGVSSVQAQLNGGQIVGQWYNGTKYNRMKQKDSDVDPEDARETYEFDLKVPDCIDGASASERRKTICAEISADRDRIWRHATGSRETRPEVLGVEAVENTDWRRKTGPVDRAELPDSQALLCWCNEPGAASVIRNFYENHRRRSDRYRVCAARRKAGKPTNFPVGMYPPGEAEAWTPDRSYEDEVGLDPDSNSDVSDAPEEKEIA